MMGKFCSCWSMQIALLSSCKAPDRSLPEASGFFEAAVHAGYSPASDDHAFEGLELRSFQLES